MICNVKLRITITIIVVVVVVIIISKCFFKYYYYCYHHVFSHRFRWWIFFPHALLFSRYAVPS